MKRLSIAVAFATGLTAVASPSLAETDFKVRQTPAHLLEEAAKESGDKKAKDDLPGVDTETTTGSIKGAAKKKAAAVSDGRFANLIEKYAQQNGIPVSLAHAVVRVESNYRPNVTGGAGEVGLMQIKPATARMMGYSGSTKGLYDPETNIRFGMLYLAKAQAVGDGSTCGTILKYNAGHAARRMNPISANYCAKVKRFMAGA